MIIRSEKKGNFTILPNAFLLDDTISDKARGLLARLLSRPDNWDLNVNHLVKTGKDGHTAVRSRLKELEAAGYIGKEVRRHANGRIIGVHYVIRDTPAADQRERVCNETRPRDVQGELFDQLPMETQARERQRPEARIEDAAVEENRIWETRNKETAPVINTDLKQILKQTTTTTPKPEPVICDPAVPSSPPSRLEILNLIPERHRSPMVVTFVNKAVADYPEKEVEQAVAYAAGNVRGGSIQFRAYLDKTLRNKWADGWAPEHENQGGRHAAREKFKHLPDANLKFLAEVGNVVALEELNRRGLMGVNTMARKAQCARA